MLIKKKVLHSKYFRLGYFLGHFSRKRRARYKFFFYRFARSLYRYRKTGLLLNFFFFLKYFSPRYSFYNFLRVKSFLIASAFYRRFYAKLTSNFLSSHKYYIALRYTLQLLRSNRMQLTGGLLSKNYLLQTPNFFLRNRRLRLQLRKFLYFRKLQSLHLIKKAFALPRLKKHQRILKSLFNIFQRINLKKIFFVTLRSSKNNTMLSVFDFLGNLLYWKTSKTVGMLGKKKSTKMAAEFLAYHLTRYLRSRKFYHHRFIFTLFGLHRHFKVVFRFIKRSIRAKRIIAMLNKSRVPHGGCYLRKKKHKGRKKHHARNSLYY